MVDQPSGEGRERGHPTVTKVFGVRGQASICFGLRGHSFAGRDLLPWCVLLTFATCGWIFISDWLRNKEDLLQRVSMTDPLQLTHTHKHIYTHTLGGIHKFHWSLHNNNIQVFFFLFSNNDCSVRFDGKEEHRNFKATPWSFYRPLPIVTVWDLCGTHGTVKNSLILGSAKSTREFSASPCDKWGTL